ncbi:DUF305 domain-containing protein [Methanobacterium sp.]|uniref:DUF305 domain-containing protein n=1 Tax=Methanobacterium sp. TaxID=2164 RepID=UPI003C7892A0
MKKLLGILLFVFVIIVGFSGAVSAADAHGHSKSLKKHHKYSDKHFIEHMVPHHKEAVQMANIASYNAEHREIKKLARNIKSTQSKEIREMNQWYKKWYGTNVPTSSMKMMGMKNQTNLNKLKTAKPFDKEFIKQMIPHHQMAIMMAQMAIKNSKQPQIRNFAKSVIKTQSAEIKEMRQWYKQWYGTNISVSSNNKMMS